MKIYIFVIMAIALVALISAAEIEMVNEGIDTKRIINLVPFEIIINATFGEMFNHTEVGNTIPISDSTTYFNITNLSRGQLNNVGFSLNSLTIEQEGIYILGWAIGLSDGGNVEFQIAAIVNGNAQENCENHRKTGTAGDVGAASGTCILSLSIGDRINLGVKNKDSTANPTFFTAQMNIHKLEIQRGGGVGGNGGNPFDQELNITSNVTFDTINVTNGGVNFADGVNATFGTGGDATIRYDGNNLIINPNVVGSGFVSIPSDSKFCFRGSDVCMFSPSSGVLRYILGGLGPRFEWVVGNAEIMRITSQGLFFNNGNEIGPDFIMKTSGSDFGFFLDSGVNAIGFFTNVLTHTFNVNGTSNFTGNMDLGSNLTIGNTLFGGRQIFSGYDTTGGLTIPIGGVPIPIDTENRDDSFYTHTTGGDNANVTINYAGDYFVEYDVSTDVSIGTTRVMTFCWLEKNGVEIAGTKAFGYNRNTADGEATAHERLLITLAVADKVQIVCKMSSGSNTLTTVADGSRFNFEFAG